MRRSRSALGLLAAATALIAGVAGMTGTSQAAPNKPSHSELVQARDAAGSRYQSDPAFAGSDIDDTAGKVRFYLTDTSAAAQDRMFGSADRSQFTVIQVKRSLEGLAQLRNKVFAHKAELIADGVPLASWGADISTNKLEVGLAPYSEAAAAKVIALVGADNVEVDTAPDLRFMTTRIVDVAPWNGGDHIDNTLPGWPDCTSGPGTRSTVNQKDYMTTAGHCGYPGASFKQQYNNGGTILGSKTTIGTVTTPHGWDLPTPLDIAFIQTSVSSLDWGNDPALFRYTQSATYRPQPGDALCSSGSFDGEIWLS